MTPTVSALVVAYDHEMFIEEAVRSALAQRHVELEVVVVDDGSTDATRERVTAIGDPRVRLLSEPHRGIERLAETYNSGLAACRGDFVAVLEGDDRWPEGKLAAQVADLADPTAVCGHGLYAVIGARGTLLRRRVPSAAPVRPGRYDALPLHLVMSYIMPVTAVIRRSSLLSIGGFQQLGRTVHWDWPTFLALAECGPFVFRPEVVGHWRKHGRSGTMQLTGSDLDGTALSLELALATRRRLRRPGLPSETVVRARWADAFARQIWHVSRVLLIGRQYGRVRHLVHGALARGCSPTLRARLLLVWIAALAHVDLEGPVRWSRRRSPLEELS